MPDLKIDVITNDIIFLNGGIIQGTDIDDLKQRVKDNLYTLTGNWFLDTTYGIDFKTFVFIKNPSLAVIETLFKDTILTAANNGLDPNQFVVDIQDFQITLDSRTRTLSITFTLTLNAVSLGSTTFSF